MSPADEASRRCPHCGEEIADAEQACPVCGHLREPARCTVHQDRQAHGQCLVCDRHLCDDCNRVEGRLYLCEAHAEVPIMDGWAQVYTTSGDLEAQLIRDNLRAEGLDAQVLSQQDHHSFTVHLGDLSPVRILVPAYEYEAAMDVIRSHIGRDGEVTFACQACGEVYDEGEEHCSACGEALR